MSDHELLDLIAERAPVPAGDYPDQMLAAGRRGRTRRRRMVGAGMALCALAAVAAIAVPVAVSGPDEGREVTAVQSPATVDTGTQAEIYRSAVQAILAKAMPGATIAEVTLLDRLCTNVLRTEEPCAARPLPAEVRRELATGEYPRMRFAASPDGLQKGQILVTLGPITSLRDDLAEAPVSFRQDPDYSVSETYRMQLQDGLWQVVTP